MNVHNILCFFAFLRILYLTREIYWDILALRFGVSFVVSDMVD